jgi:hypothetical protein
MGGGGGGMPIGGGMPCINGGGGGGGGMPMGGSPIPGGGAMPGGSTGIGGGGGGMPIGIPSGMPMGAIAWGPVAKRVCGCPPLRSFRALAASSLSASVPCLSPRESFLYAYLGIEKRAGETQCKSSGAWGRGGRT